MHSIYFDADSLEAVYNQASAQDMSTRWRNALDRAYDLLMLSDPILVKLDADNNIKLACIPSQSEEHVTYVVNHACNCHAAQNGVPCTHRAAKRLLERAHERFGIDSIAQADETPELLEAYVAA